MSEGPEHRDRDDDSALAGEYALGLLTPDAARAFEARLAREPELRAAYAFWAGALVTFTDDIEEVAPPAAVRARLERALFGAARPGRSRRFGLWRLLAGALTACVLGLALLLGFGERPGPAGPELRAELAAEDQSLRVLARYDPAAQALHLNTARGGAAQGRSLELWLIAGDAAPVSLGVLADGPESVLAVPERLVPLLAGGVLALTDEPPGGSPTGVATGPVVAVGPITAS